jgi:hypothetical protein
LCSAAVAAAVAAVVACCSPAAPTAENTTIPLNLTSLMQFTLANATCDSALVNALIAAFDEEKRQAAEADGLEFDFTTTLVNCTQVCVWSVHWHNAMQQDCHVHMHATFPCDSCHCTVSPYSALWHLALYRTCSALRRKVCYRLYIIEHHGAD